MVKRAILVGVAIFYVPSVYGYIDPATGGMFLGSIWTIIASIGAIIGAFFARFFIRPIKRAFSKAAHFLKSVAMRNSDGRKVSTNEERNK